MDMLTKLQKNWQDKLIKECIKAVKASKNLVSWNVFESYFEKIGRLDEKINVDDIPDAFILGIDLGENPTIRSIVALFKNPKLDQDSWETLDKTLWKIYCRLTDGQNGF